MTDPFVYVQRFEREFEAAKQDHRGPVAYFRSNSEWLDQLEADRSACLLLEQVFQFGSSMKKVLNNDSEAETILDFLREDLKVYHRKVYGSC